MFEKTASAMHLYRVTHDPVHLVELEHSISHGVSESAPPEGVVCSRGSVVVVASGVGLVRGVVVVASGVGLVRGVVVVASGVGLVRGVVVVASGVGLVRGVVVVVALVTMATDVVVVVDVVGSVWFRQARSQVIARLMESSVACAVTPYDLIHRSMQEPPVQRL